MISDTDKVFNLPACFLAHEEEQCELTIQSDKKTPTGGKATTDGLSLIQRSLSCSSPGEQGQKSNTSQVFLSKWQL